MVDATVNKAYLAGIIDGEGHIGFSQSRNSYYPRLFIVNTNTELIEDLLFEYGGCVSKLKRKENWKQAYQWKIANRKCVNLLDSVYKYLRIKSDQASLVFIWDAIRPGVGKDWTQDGREAMQLILDEIKWLNYRGLGRSQHSPVELTLNPWLSVRNA